MSRLVHPASSFCSLSLLSRPSHYRPLRSLIIPTTECPRQTFSRSISLSHCIRSFVSSAQSSHNSQSSDKQSNNKSNSNGNDTNGDDASSGLKPEIQWVKRHKRPIILSIVSVFGIATLTYAYNAGRAKFEEDELTLLQQLNEGFKEITTISTSPLLPTVQLDQYGRRPRTLVLNFDKTIISTQWSRFGGWQVSCVRKR